MRAVILILLLALGCAHAKTPAQRYYAAKTNYAAAGDLVNSWCAQPTTPREHCEEVDQVMDRTEVEIAAIDALVAPGDSSYEYGIALMTEALRIASMFLPEVKQ
jgi:hypothetical protein